MKNVKKGFSLTKDEIRELSELRRKLQGAKHYALRNRIRGVLLTGGDARMKNGEAARKCKVHVRTLRAWLARYRENGIEGLKHKPVSGTPSKLTPEQKEELKKIVKEGPEEHGYDTGIWTASMLCQVVSKKFDVRYSLSGMQALLGRLNMSFKLPQKKRLAQAKKHERGGWM